MIKRKYVSPQGIYETTGPYKGVLTNAYGSYFILDSESSYQGWGVLQTKSWTMQKTIESITPMSEGECTELYTNGFSLQRTFSSGAKDAFVLYQNTLLYTMNGIKDYLKLTLDHRGVYDSSKPGRLYEIKIDDDFILISFKKQENSSESEKSYIGIKGIKKAELIDSWKEKTYSEDKKRKSESSFWVYEAIKLMPRNHVVFSNAQSANEARVLADISYYHFDEILNNIHHKADKKLFVNHGINYEDTEIASQCAVNNLLSLTQIYSFDHRLTKGILAGLPWFFQLWSRDELISLGGLLSLAKHEKYSFLIPTIKTILSRHINSIQKDGQLSNRFPKADLASIDSLPWLAKRIHEFILLLRDKTELYNMISPKELFFWKHKLKLALDKSKESYLNKKGLFENSSCETWMDTSYHDDGREGSRIEIQSLFLALYDSLIFITELLGDEGNEYNKNLILEKESFKKKIRQHFIRDDFEGLVIDGYNKSWEADYTYRPNVFLAIYVSPKLFTISEKKKIVKKYLQELLLSWGGLSTLPSYNNLYQSEYTGEDDKSYHRGDSWYFINNITAIVLARIDHEYFKQTIKKIQLASVKDILEEGYIACASELSSASSQEACGSLSQAWSASTFVELISILYPEEE